MLPFPKVVQLITNSSPNPTELLALTLKVYIVLGVRSGCVYIVLPVIILISSGVPVILYCDITCTPPPLSLGGLHCNVNELFLISVQLVGRGSGGDGTAVKEIIILIKIRSLFVS